MIITYFRSSSYTRWDFCPQLYFIEYCLGWSGKSGKKADKGTIVHKILEILALIKKARQDNKTTIIDDLIGKLDVKNIDIDTIVCNVYDYYTNGTSHHAWTEADRRDCTNWTHKALNYNNGQFNPLNREIVDTEPFFDFEIQEPWATFSYEVDGEIIDGFLSMKGTIDLVTKIEDGILEIVDWKGLLVTTPIPTPDGWSTMGELKVNDTVFDKDGNQVKVIGKSKKKYKNCYKITFDDTSTVICDNEHLWYLDNEKVVDVTKLNIGDKINVTQPLQAEQTDLPIDPYVLGAWLGDGRNRGGEISSADDIWTEIEKRGYKLGQNIEKRIDKNCQARTVYGLTTLLKSLNLCHNKHIPSIYLRASYQQRLDLLRGLMDSDGSVNTIRKQAVFTACNKQLSDDVKELATTLGQRVNQSHIKTITTFTHGKKVDVFQLHFRPININPFLLARKADKIGNWGPGKSDKRTIKQIELLKTKRQTQCIMVDSPTNTYLCTRNMIPTHNTGRRLDWATGKEKTQASLQDDPQLRIYHYAAHKLYNVDQILITIYYINDGGPFTICFDKSDLKKTEEIIKQRFLAIKKNTCPTLNKSWKCTKLCDAGKTTFCDTCIKPYLDEDMYPMTKCEQVQRALKRDGMEQVIKDYTKPGFVTGKYKNPGEIES